MLSNLWFRISNFVQELREMSQWGVRGERGVVYYQIQALYHPTEYNLSCILLKDRFNFKAHMYVCRYAIISTTHVRTHSVNRIKTVLCSHVDLYIVYTHIQSVDYVSVLAGALLPNSWLPNSVPTACYWWKKLQLRALIGPAALRQSHKPYIKKPEKAPGNGGQILSPTT